MLFLCSFCGLAGRGNQQMLHHLRRYHAAQTQEEWMNTITQLAVSMFQAYNAQGPNPNKTWDGKDVPPWEKLGDQVQGKWLAAAECALKPSERQVLPPGTQPPSVGRIVLFTEEGGPYASLISAVNEDGTVELATVGRNSLYFQHGIRFDADGSKGTWRWPPRV